MFEQEYAAVTDGVMFDGPPLDDDQLAQGRSTLWGSALSLTVAVDRATPSSLQTWRRKAVVVVQL